MRFELMTSSLPRKCSTTELHGQPFILAALKWSGRRGSNSRPLAWKANALPTELLPLVCGGGRRIRTFEGFSRQIYSLIPLTAWVSPPGWSWQWDSNPQPADYKSAALPIELCQHKANAEFNLYFEFCQSFEGIERNFTSGFRLPGGWDRLRPSGREEELEPHDRC